MKALSGAHPRGKPIGFVPSAASKSPRTPEEGVVGVVMDEAQPRDSVIVVELESGTALRASPYPRPVPGVPPERNFNGISFAVANVTGVLARLLDARPDVATAEEAIALLG